MPDQMPPPGPERDRAILLALGYREAIRDRRAGDLIDTSAGEGPGWWTRQDGKLDHAPGTGLAVVLAAPNGDPRCELPPDGPWPAYSTDPAAADRLVEEMVRRGWLTQSNVFRYASGDIGHSASVHRGFRGGEMIDPSTKVGETRPDAVSAAALLALRGGA